MSAVKAIIMKNIFLLSIHDKYASMILNGVKKWEFRRNPRFGILLNKEIGVGDLVFLVNKSSEGKPPAIECMCRVLSVLREGDMRDYFYRKESGKWKEAGCEDNTERNWEFFVKSILDVYLTAIELKPYPVKPSIDGESIRHCTKNTPWKAIGLVATEDLKRFSVNGLNVTRYFEKIAEQTLKNNQCC